MPRLEFPSQLVAPGGEHVGPRLDGVLEPSHRVDVEAPRPAHAAEVRVDPLHLGLAPAAAAGAAKADHRAEQLVTVTEHVGLDPHTIADAPLRRVAAIIDRRARVLDHDARRRLLGASRGRSRRTGRLDSGHGARHTLESIQPGRSGKPPRVNGTGPSLRRSSGVLLHVTSLPGGRLGPEAHRFVDWLAVAGQSWWQVLPLGPPDRYGSPYKARSAFAAWPGLLGSPRAPVSSAELLDFRERNAWWILDWERFAGRGAVADQVRFEREWGELRQYGAERGVRLFGDVAIYVAPGSADHRAHPELFKEGFVAGAPPDAFSASGQLWGNPLYDWPALRRRRYGWWVGRLRRTLELFELARIDHFRGFVVVLGGAGGGTHGKVRALDARAGACAVRRAGARARPAPAGRRGPGGDHPSGGPAARRAAAAGDDRAPVRVRRRTTATALTGSRTRPRTG